MHSIELQTHEVALTLRSFVHTSSTSYWEPTCEAAITMRSLLYAVLEAVGIHILKYSCNKGIVFIQILHIDQPSSRKNPTHSWD